MIETNECLAYGAKVWKRYIFLSLSAKISAIKADVSDIISAIINL
ncbi:hypothetical protein N8376_02575 [Flavobacteriaceae bacterium]|nr:hypothetical protein [Flavobacteriaceae bacterium]MDC1492227.1 hypothetical protein [Flavobacteriaceae bacterium]